MATRTSWEASDATLLLAAGAGRAKCPGEPLSWAARFSGESHQCAGNLCRKTGAYLFAKGLSAFLSAMSDDVSGFDVAKRVSLGGSKIGGVARPSEVSAKGGLVGFDANSAPGRPQCSASASRRARASLRSSNPANLTAKASASLIRVVQAGAGKGLRCCAWASSDAKQAVA